MFIKELKKDLNSLGYLIYPVDIKGSVKKFDVFDPKRKDYLITGKDTAIINKFLSKVPKYEFLICFHKKGRGQILNKIHIKNKIERKRKMKKDNDKMFFQTLLID